MTIKYATEQEKLSQNVAKLSEQIKKATKAAAETGHSLKQSAKATKALKNVTAKIEHQDSTGAVHSVDAQSPVPGSENACTVGMHLARTVNLGNYNSIKVGVSLTVPCDVVEVDSTFEFVSGWIDMKLTGILDLVAQGASGMEAMAAPSVDDDDVIEDDEAPSPKAQALDDVDDVIEDEITEGDEEVEDDDPDVID